MRFFLVRILGFTVLFTGLLLMLSWIAPTRTGNTVQALTSWWPIQEQVDTSDSDLIITDLSEGEDTHVSPNTHVPSNTHGDSKSDKIDTNEDEKQSDTIVIEKEKNYNNDDVIKEMDNVLNIDHQPDNSDATHTDNTNTTNTDEYEPTPPEPMIKEDEEVNHLPDGVKLSPDELQMLEEFNQIIQ